MVVRQNNLYKQASCGYEAKLVYWMLVYSYTINTAINKEKKLTFMYTRISPVKSKT